MIYGVSPQGQLTRTLRMTPDLDGTFAMRNLRMLGPETMQFDETGRQSELTITVAKIAGKFRSWRSVRADGTFLIADGKFASSGNPTSPSRSAATDCHPGRIGVRPSGSDTGVGNRQSSLGDLATQPRLPTADCHV